jgi:hypothetical protein
MKQILSKGSAIIITKKEVMTINHPTTIFTDDDVEVVTGKDEKSTKEALSETQIKQRHKVMPIRFISGSLRTVKGPGLKNGVTWKKAKVTRGNTMLKCLRIMKNLI